MANNAGPHVYLLVHPELWPSNDPDVTHEMLHDLTGQHVDDAYGCAVAASSGRADRRVVVDDGSVAEEVSTFGAATLAGVVDLATWELLPASPKEVARAVTQWASALPAGCTVTVAGFNRYDCVARVVTALRALAIQVSVDELATLPCTDASARALRSRVTRTRATRPVTGRDTRDATGRQV